MRSKFILSLFTLLILGACASHDGKSVSSIDQAQQEALQARLNPVDRFTR